MYFVYINQNPNLETFLLWLKWKNWTVEIISNIIFWKIGGGVKKNALKNPFLGGFGLLKSMNWDNFFPGCPKWLYKNFQSEGFSFFGHIYFLNRKKKKIFFTPPQHVKNTVFSQNVLKIFQKYVPESGFLTDFLRNSHRYEMDFFWIWNGSDFFLVFFRVLAKTKFTDLQTLFQSKNFRNFFGARTARQGPNSKLKFSYLYFLVVTTKKIYRFLDRD